MTKHTGFRRWHDAGFTGDLIPIIPVGGVLTPGTSVKPHHVGKVPGVLTAAGTWSGLGGKWSDDPGQDATGLKRWTKWGASVGLQSRNFPGLDIDVDDKTVADDIQSLAEDYLGLAPVRTRAGSSRRLMMYQRIRIDVPMRKVRQEFGAHQAVELLAKGQQYVVEGPHVAGGAYEWLGEHPCDLGAENIPLISAEEVERFFRALADLLRASNAPMGKEVAQSAALTGGARKPLSDPSLWAPSPEGALGILAKTPPERFETRDELVQFLAAVWASLGADRLTYRADVIAWAMQYPGAEEDFTTKILDSFTDAALGWGWLSHAFGGLEAAQAVFDDDGATIPAQHNTLESMLSRYVYSTGQSTYYDMTSGEPLTATNFNSRNTNVARFGLSGVQAAASVFQNEPRARKVATTTYRPGGEPLITEKVNGIALSAVNLWRPSAMKPADGVVTDTDVAPWLDHVSMLFGDPGAPAREHVLNYMAFVLQHPGEKINHAIVILSNTQGVGKDTVFVPFLAAAGHHNAWVVMPEDLQGQFNPYVERQIIVVAEMANFNKKEMTNKIKPLLASPPFFIQVNKKNLGQYSIPNLGNVIMFTNYDNAISIDDEDRRYWVHRSLTEEARGKDYFRPIYDWYGPKPLYDGRGSQLVMKWLLQRDLSGFDPCERPAMTAAKEEMIEGGLPQATKWLATQFEKGEAFHDRKLVAAFELTDHGKHAFNSPSGAVLGMHAVQALKRAGYTSTRDKCAVGDGKIVRLWAKNKACFSWPHWRLAEYYAAETKTKRA